MSCALAWDTTTVELKPWPEYSDKERRILLERWKPAEVDTVIQALKKGKELPKFIITLPFKESRFVSGHDLRGIPLYERDLRNISLSYKHLQGADFYKADLQGVSFSGANLQGASFEEANLPDAVFSDADLSEANLSNAQLQRADFTGSNLKKARLKFAHLEHAKLIQTSLRDANLYWTTLDSTYLAGTKLDQAENIRFIIWGDKYRPRYVIAEEEIADLTKKQQDFLEAQVTYKYLKVLYKKELLDHVAIEFNYRENEVKTKIYPWISPLRWFRFFLLKLTYGYGSRPFRLMWYSLIVIVGFAIIFTCLTLLNRKSGFYLLIKGRHGTKVAKALPRRPKAIFICIYLSLLTFAYVGYGVLTLKPLMEFSTIESSEYKPVHLARILVIIEALMGIWILALLSTLLFTRS